MAYSVDSVNIVRRGSPTSVVLVKFGRGCTGLAELAALDRGVFLDARLWVLRHAAFALCWPAARPGLVGRWGRRIGLAAYVACSACGRLADAGPDG
jgi:hypothetical protein